MLRGRVLAALMGLLSLTILVAFLTVHAAVLHPFIVNLHGERVDLALYIAEQIEASPDPGARAQQLSAQMHAEVRLLQDTSELSRRLDGSSSGSSSDRASARRQERVRERIRDRAQVFTRDDREILVFPGPRTPVAVPIHQTTPDPAWVVVRFPVDLEAPPRRIGVGLLILMGVALLTAWGMARWVLRPLEVASDAMTRVAAGDLRHRLPTGTDVTGRISETFNRMAERVAGLVAGQRQMMAAVSHEVRTPLSRMRLQVELLRDAGADPERLAALEADIGEVDGLIEELLESARLEQGGLALRREPLRVQDLVTEALVLVDLGERPVQLQVEPADLEGVGDRRRLLRAVSNLLSNVARYTPPETMVMVRAAALDGEPGGVRLEVADTGPGVPEAALPRLFDPFFRAEESRSRATGGLGLGLMLVRQIVEAHGGQITARNRPEGGLSMVLTLPAATATMAAAGGRR